MMIFDLMDILLSIALIANFILAIIMKHPGYIGMSLISVLLWIMILFEIGCK